MKPAAPSRPWRTLWLAYLISGVTLASSATVSAQPGPGGPPGQAPTTQLFLAWPGISGPSTVPGFVGTIQLLSYAQAASNMPGGALCGQVTFTKRIDTTSPIFLGMVFSGSRTAGPVTVTFVNSTSGAQTPFYTVNLSDVVAISVGQSDDPRGGVIETIVLSASKFLFTSTQSGGGPPINFGWDCALGKQV
jgi:type VI protein secretion system component Hcp